MSLEAQLKKLKAYFYKQKSTKKLILPSHIRLTETYQYELSISLQPYKKLRDRPVGYVDLIVPDEDWRKLSNQSPEHDTLITIIRYERTDLDARLSQYELEGPYFPLHQIFKQALSYPGIDYERSNLPHRIRVPYAPDPPKEPVINLNVLIFDEVTVTKQDHIYTFLTQLQQKETAAGDLEGDETFAEKLLEALVEKRGFMSELTIEFDLSLNLPKFSSDDLPKQHPILSQMSLSWPINLPRHQIYLETDTHHTDFPNTITKQRHDVIFDPKNNSLAWRHMTFDRESENGVENTLLFRLPKIHLKINNPVELQRHWDTNANIPNDLNDTLFGSVFIHLPGYLLSGLKFDYSKKRPEIDKAIYLESFTTIKANFTILAQTIFAQRTFSPYQFMHFPNVVLSDMRLADIMLLLQDMRFYAVRVNFPANFKGPDFENNQEKRTKPKRHLIVAGKTVGGKNMALWLVVEGFPSGTVREREIPGNEKFSTSLQTGSMVIHMRGEINQEQDTLIKTMTEIHDMLKERFRHVNTIE